MVTVNVFYSEMVNWEKQDMVLKNHGHELNYGNLILQDRKIFGNYFYFKYIIPKCLMRIWINELYLKEYK
jgi:hypothetical protein